MQRVGLATKSVFYSIAHADSSLREVVERILPLAHYSTSIDAFVEAHSHLDYGLVNHALCAAVRERMKVSDALRSIYHVVCTSLSVYTFTIGFLHTRDPTGASI